MKRIITFGTFDVLHIGHIRIIQRASALGDFLVVGVSSDAMNFSKKERYPVYSEKDRMEIVASIKGVDEVFREDSMDFKADYIKKYKADVLVMGNDWEGRFDEFKSICDVIYLPRTDGVSTTQLIQEIKSHG